MAAALHIWHHNQADLQYTPLMEPVHILAGSQDAETSLQRRMMEEAERD
jgi:hypothetical protein